jgi:hypothetical protein
MEKFYFEKPSSGRKEDIIGYLKEHEEAGSSINGTGPWTGSFPDGHLKRLWRGALRWKRRTMPLSRGAARERLFS